VTSDDELSENKSIDRVLSGITLKYDGAINLDQIDEQTIEDSESSSSLSESSSEDSEIDESIENSS